MVFGAGWHPPEASLANEPKEYEGLLPLTEDTLSIAASHTVLAAIHDATYKAVELINPWENLVPPSDSLAERKFSATSSEYSEIVKQALRIPEDDVVSVEALCIAVETDIGVIVDGQDVRTILTAESEATSVVSSPDDIAPVGVTRDISALGRAHSIAQEILDALPPASLDRPRKVSLISIEQLGQFSKRLTNRTDTIPRQRGNVSSPSASFSLRADQTSMSGYCCERKPATYATTVRRFVCADRLFRQSES